MPILCWVGRSCNLTPTQQKADIWLRRQAMQDDNQIQEHVNSVSEKYDGLELADFHKKQRHNDYEPVVSVQEYRKKLNDYESTDEQIIKRLEYVEALCRNVIRQEIENYAEKSN